MADPSMDLVSGGSRKRVSKACDYCRRRKIRCGPINAITGKCDNCTKSNMVCTFNHHDELERQRRELEDGKLQENDRKRSKPGIKPVGVSQQHEPTGNPSKVEIKLANLEAQLGTLIKWLAASEMNLPTDDNATPKQTPVVKRKRYTTSLLTRRKIIWLKEKTASVLGKAAVGSGGDANEPLTVMPNNSDASPDMLKTFMPLKNVLLCASKWYIAKMKMLIELPSHVNSVNTSPFPFPSRAECSGVLESFAKVIFKNDFNVMRGEELTLLIDRYFAGGKMSYSELLLLNITLCSSTNYDLQNYQYLTRDTVAPDTEARLSDLQEKTLANSMFYFHKMSLICDGIRSIQALLLLYQHINSEISSELGYNIFCTAVRFAQLIGLNQRESFKNLPYSEAVTRMAVWSRCVSLDAQLCLSFSKQPLLDWNDTDVLTDEFYLEFINEYYIKQDNQTTHSETPQTVSVALNSLLGDFELIYFGLSYYSTKLSKISHMIYSYFFSVGATNGVLFDEMIQRVFEIKRELREWEKSLPYAYSAQSYEQYLAIIRSRESPPSEFELASAAVNILYIHFEHLYLVIMVSLFTCSFLLDNTEAHHLSRFDIADLSDENRSQLLDSTSKILLMWKKVILVPNLLDRIFYTFSTGAFVLLLWSIKHIDNPRIGEHIKLLCDLHESLRGGEALRKLAENIKYNVFMFVYTFLLILCIRCFNKRNLYARVYQFRPSVYESVLSDLGNMVETMKNTSVASLRRHLEQYPPANLDKTNCESFQKRVPRMLNLFNDLEFEDIETLASSMPILLTRTQEQRVGDIGSQENLEKVGSGVPHAGKSKVTVDQSLFPEPAFIGLDSNGLASTPIVPYQDDSIIPPITSDALNFDELFDNMLFDRDFSLPANYMQ
ncbi:LAMI_0B06876g1_1 [Lachancea mirantina]|uniref:LAMI_0B06876g1_1 n=1 Tax=Lachancea mirantina TaxID=1230905 RepID=A0A1G4IWT0_9SACH|nr:LAMI_0B06876g1_1 [Lachancea mirantina]